MEGSETIRVLCRIRPSKRPSGYFTADGAAGVLHFSVPSDLPRDVTNNAGAAHAFKFGSVFDGSATQEDVFDAVARDAVDSSLAGFNSTVFAYGQTGSGKTFTITGGAERYADRGIIPRCLQRIFAAVKEATKVRHTVRISYMEIYNENAYDLLDSAQETKALEELPCVWGRGGRAAARRCQAPFCPRCPHPHPPPLPSPRAPHTFRTLAAA